MNKPYSNIEMKAQIMGGNWALEPNFGFNLFSSFLNELEQPTNYIDLWKAFYNTQLENLTKTNGVLVLKASGALTNRSFWGYGYDITRTFILEYVKDNPAIKEFHLVIDSPGGEVAGLEQLSRVIRSLSIPTIAFIENIGCSAAMYLAQSCSKVYASKPTDLVGSIGTMMSWVSFAKYYEKAGIEVKNIYAPQSSKKGYLSEEAAKGNFKPIQEELLRPIAQEFIDYIKDRRKNLPESIFDGRTFNADYALEIGLIDGIEQYEFYNSSSINSPVSPIISNTSNTMNLKQGGFFSKLLGLTSEAQISQEDFDKLEAKASELETKAAELETKLNALRTEKTDLSAKVDSLTASVSAKDAEISKLTQENARAKELLENSPSTPLGGKSHSGWDDNTLEEGMQNLLKKIV